MALQLNIGDVDTLTGVTNNAPDATTTWTTTNGAVVGISTSGPAASCVVLATGPGTASVVAVGGAGAAVVVYTVSTGTLAGEGFSIST